MSRLNVLVTGASNPIGERLIRILLADSRISRILAVCGTETTSCTVAARLLGELPVGEVATFDVDHTLRYNGERGTVEPCSSREKPDLVRDVSELGDRV